MPPLQQVRPGDLITANVINTMIAEIEQLKLVVSGLSTSSSSTPIITDVLPPGVLRCGEEENCEEHNR